ncbi:MAG: hypothetical protein GWP08_18985 [Nitrospiraceae bacterium]|nr:hypothetical protein [Nitrospiraceae bacterium]
MRTMRSACIVSLALLIGFGVMAQENPGSEGKAVGDERRGGMGPGPGPEAEKHEVEELMEAVMTARLAKTLGLNDEQTVLMVRRFSEYKERLSHMRREREEMLRDVRNALREGQEGAAIEPLLGALVEKDIEIAKYRLGAFQTARNGLTVKQQAQLYVFLSEFDADMRHLIQKVRSKRMERPGGFGDRPGRGPGMGGAYPPMRGGGGRGRGGMGMAGEPPQFRRPPGRPGQAPRVEDGKTEEE